MRDKFADSLAEGSKGFSSHVIFIMRSQAAEFDGQPSSRT